MTMNPTAGDGDLSDDFSSDLPGDARPFLARAAEQLARLVALAGPQDVGRPTPCAEYDVAGLVGHVLAVLHRVAYVAGGGHAFDVPSTVDVPQPDWAAAAERGAAELIAAWQDDAVLDRVLALPWGQVPGRGAAVAYVQELTTHSWDLARALQRPEPLDAELGALALTAARRFVPDVNRSVIPFGPVVGTTPDADVYAQLVAWLGRRPDWTPLAVG